MNVFNNNLYIGTFDWSIVITTSALQIADELGFSTLMLHGATVDDLANFLNSAIFTSIINVLGEGADIWRFTNNTSGAIPEALDGLGNPFNYGIRTMTSDANALYVGTANPFNLEIPNGGWELWEGVPIAQ